MTEELREGVVLCVVCLRKNGCVCRRVMEHFTRELMANLPGPRVPSSHVEACQDCGDIRWCCAESKARAEADLAAAQKELAELKWMREGLEK